MKATAAVLGLAVDGDHRWVDRSIDEVSGAGPRSLTLKDLESLSWRGILRLFHAAPAPRIDTLQGEYRAAILPAGVFAPLAALFTHRFFGPGGWHGKAFKALGGGRGEGYNLFTVTRASAAGEAAPGAAGRAADDLPLARTRRFDTIVAASRFDGRPSLCLDYRLYNRFLVHSMWDEVRQLGPELFLGLGTMAAGGGALNPAAFVLYGKPQPWRGV